MQTRLEQRLPLLFIVATLATGAVLACGGGPDADADTETDADVGADADTETDADADADEDGDAERELDPPTEDWTRDILRTSLVVDVSAMTGTATMTMAPSPNRGASFEVGTLDIMSVALGGGGELLWESDAGELHVGMPAGVDPATVVIEYAYSISPPFEGAMDTGVTLTWPYFCGNLFPCHSDPADGTELELELLGLGDGEVAVYATEIRAESPSYALAWAIGDYEALELGTTAGGVSLSAWYRPGEADAAARGTEHLLEAFEWYETTLGPYPFGDHAGTVAVTWGPGAIGGMEHHPFWHVGGSAFGDEATQFHEAAHGWFGNGVRIACWEDFVLSEGTVSYLEARALEEVVGVEAADAVWDAYRRELNMALWTDAMKIAWPDSCGEVDILEDRLFSRIPYTKGAFFFRALEARVGVEPLLSALAAFYSERVETAATFDELLDAIAAQTGYDPTDCANAWLRTEDPPEDLDVCP